MINQPPIQRSKTIAGQVQDLLRQRISQGVYPPGERMPSEERLAKELNVSRATVRSALAAAASEGLVQRRHGDGTYPTPRVFELSLRAKNAWDIENQIRQRGYRASNKILEQNIRPATAHEHARLTLEPGEPVLAIRRLFLANDQPVMLAVHIVRSEGLDPGFPPAAVQQPMLEFLDQYHRRRIHSGYVHFKSILGGENAEALQVDHRNPLLLLEALISDENGQPMLLAWEYYRGQDGFVMPIAPFQP